MWGRGIGGAEGVGVPPEWTGVGGGGGKKHIYTPTPELPPSTIPITNGTKSPSRRSYATYNPKVLSP